MKKLKWISLISFVVLFFGAFSWKAFALEYIYDDLNRLISAKEDSGQMTHYEYDATGNLLSVSTSSGSESAATSANGVSEGWLPYFTSGVTAEYELVVDNNEVQPVSETEDSVTEPNDSKTEPVGSEVELHDSETEPSDSVSEPNGSEVALNDSEAELHESETEPEDSGTELNDSVTQPSESATESNDSETENVPLAAQFISAQASIPGGANVYKDIPVVGSNIYTIKGTVKVESLTNAAAQVIVNYYDHDGQLLGHKNVFNQLEISDWTSFEQNLTVPGNAETARIHLQLLLQDEDSAGVAGFTNVQFDSAIEP